MLSENYLCFSFTALANGSGIMEGGESVLHACLLLEDEREEESITLNQGFRQLPRRRMILDQGTIPQASRRSYKHKKEKGYLCKHPRGGILGDNTRKRKETPLQTQEMGILW